MDEEIKVTTATFDFCQKIRHYLSFYGVSLEDAGKWINSSRRTMTRKMQAPQNLTVEEISILFRNIQKLEDSRRRIVQR
jgi:hypothetical protein